MNCHCGEGSRSRLPSGKGWCLLLPLVLQDGGRAPLGRMAAGWFIRPGFLEEEPDLKDGAGSTQWMEVEADLGVK